MHTPFRTSWYLQGCSCLDHIQGKLFPFSMLSTHCWLSHTHIWCSCHLVATKCLKSVRNAEENINEKWQNVKTIGGGLLTSAYVDNDCRSVVLKLQNAARLYTLSTTFSRLGFIRVTLEKEQLIRFCNVPPPSRTEPGRSCRWNRDDLKKQSFVEWKA